MKKIIRLLLFVFVIATLSECKKGEDDPFISFRARKARVVGEWTLKEGSGIYTENYTNYSLVVNQVFTGSAYSYVYTEIDNGSTQTFSGAGIYSYKIEFKKDGTYESTEIEDNDIEIASGVWNFTKGVGEYKNKEQIVLTQLSRNYNGSTTTYTGKNIDQCFSIKELRNKKMVLLNETSSSSNGYVDAAKTEKIMEQ